MGGKTACRTASTMGLPFESLGWTWTEGPQELTTGRGGAVGVFNGAGGIDLVDGAAQFEQLPPRPALDAMAPACSLHPPARISQF